MLIKEYISNEIPTLGSDRPFVLALTIMDELKIVSIPIVEDNKYLGLLPESIIYELDLFDKTINTSLHFLKNVFLSPDNSIVDALNIFIHEDIDMIPIVDENKLYLGIITKSNLLKALAKLIASEEAGEILILNMNYNDLHISEIAKIIENEDANIINLFVQPIPSSTEINVIIKINKMDISRIVKSFCRYNYNVISLSHNDDDDEDLSQKYELFMKYLNL